MSVFSYLGHTVQGYTPEEALTQANLDWTVSKRPVMVADEDGNMHTSSRFFANTRDDNNAILGVVGREYTIIQNQELMYLCERLSPQGVSIETAGSLHGGARVWVQMRGDPFGVGETKDEVVPYCLMTNGHNGMHPFASLPVTFRVICQNTLNLAMNQSRRNNTLISLKHSGNVQDRLESMIDAIQEFKYRSNVFANQAEVLARKPVTSEFVQNFWTQVYTEMFGEIHANPTKEWEQEDNKSAISTMMKWSNVFDLEAKESGANLWTAMNSVTNWLDHDQLYRGDNKTENRFNDILFGDGSKEKVKVFKRALEFV